MRRQDARVTGALELAYIGDTVHDLYVREKLIAQGYGVGQLHRRAVKLVCAHAQARWAQAIEPSLTDEERDLIRRGRNTHARHAAPKNADPAEYQLATGLEALWGYLYLARDTQRLGELLEQGYAALMAQGG